MEYNNVQLSSCRILNNDILLNTGDWLPLKLPIALQLEITSRCNLKCPFCYNSSGNRHMGEKDISPTIFTGLVEEIVKAGGVFQCIISGGEPTLVLDQFSDLLDILKHDATSLALISNGTGIDKRMIRFLKQYDWEWIQISIDSSEESKHDTIRGNPGTFKTAMKAIAMLNENQIPFIIASAISDYNIHDIEGIVKLAISNGAKEIIFSEIIPSGRASTQKFDLSVSNKRLFKNTIAELEVKYQKDIIITKAASYKDQLLHSEKYCPLSCIVRPNGDVKLNCVLPFVIGNIKKERFMDIWNNAYRLVHSTIFKQYIELACKDFELVIPNNVNKDIYFMEEISNEKKIL